MRNANSVRLGLATLALGGVLTLSSTALAAGVGDAGPAATLAANQLGATMAPLMMRGFTRENWTGGWRGSRGGTGVGQRPGGPRGGFGPGFGANLQTVATALNLTTQQLQQQLRSGQSIAQIAQTQNVALQTVKDAITAAVKSRLDQAVAAGRLTGAQETQRLNALQSSLDAHLNATGGRFPRPLGRVRRPAATATATPTVPASGS